MNVYIVIVKEDHGLHDRVPVPESAWLDPQAADQRAEEVGGTVTELEVQDPIRF